VSKRVYTDIEKSNQILKEQKSINNIPQFQLPPPQPSATYIIPFNFSKKHSKLSDIDKILVNALTKASYARWSYYSVPQGFAIATQLEQIDKFGNPFPEDNRWNNKNINKQTRLSISTYIKALFNSTPGYYRCIIFIVTPDYFSFTPESVIKNEAYHWIDKGLNKLPNKLGNKDFTTNHTITAVVYEFKKLENSNYANTIIPSRHTGKTHLEKAKILSNLK